jgi:hypothetical protein
VVRLVRIVTTYGDKQTFFIFANLYTIINTFRHGINFVVYFIFNNVFREVALETFKLRRG